MSGIEFKREQLRKVLVENSDVELNNLQVGLFMTARPTCISPELTARELVELFYEKGFRHLLVAEDERLVGVISDRDIRGCLGLGDSADIEKLAQIKAADLMSTDLITVGPGAPLGPAVTAMIEQGINCLPVVADDRPIGILTSTDLYLLLEELLCSARLAPQAEPAHSGE